ncbi:hypothetical protein AB0D73_35470 [Streptomyces sp. NPDC048215]|uniref:hypothetical protein n=1 Tax=Streptomyces sp. NPDC048215 TaxID=3156690 RepID=UPI0033E06EEE
MGGLEYGQGLVQAFQFRLLASGFATAEEPGEAATDPVSRIRARGLHDRAASGSRDSDESLDQHDIPLHQT